MEQEEMHRKNARSLFDRAYPAIHHHLSQWEKSSRNAMIGAVLVGVEVIARTMMLSAPKR